MKKLILILIVSMHFSLAVFAQQEDCDKDAIPLPGRELLETMDAVSQGLYKDISKLKVNHDGEGKLSVFYENGRPMLLKLYYKNKKGTMVKEISFADLERGKPLIFENAEKPGKALIFEKAPVFQNDNTYNFKLSVRISLNPDKYKSYNVAFHSDEKNPAVLTNNKKFKDIIVSPGISWLSWDGTFEKVDFVN